MTEDLDIKLIKYMQDGLPLTKTPYKDIADGLGMTEDAVIEKLSSTTQRKDMVSSQVMMGQTIFSIKVGYLMIFMSRIMIM